LWFSFFFCFSSLPPPPPRSTLFPYTTLFRSDIGKGDDFADANRRSSGIGCRSDCVPRRIPTCDRRPRSGLHALYRKPVARGATRSEEHTSELQSLRHLVCRLLLEKKNNLRET